MVKINIEGTRTAPRGHVTARHSPFTSPRRYREPAETVANIIERGRAAGIKPARIERYPKKGPLPKLTRARRKALRAKLALHAKLAA